MPSELKTITVGQLREELKTFHDDWELTFSGCLEFFRTKARGDNRVDIEFLQSVWRDPKTGEYSIEDPRSQTE